MKILPIFIRIWVWDLRVFSGVLPQRDSRTLLPVYYLIWIMHECLLESTTYKYYLAESKFNMEKVDKVYLVFGRPVVEPDIDQLIQVKQTASMTLNHGASVFIHQNRKKKRHTDGMQKRTSG